jgi:hypothetical protein
VTGVTDVTRPSGRSAPIAAPLVSWMNSAIDAVNAFNALRPAIVPISRGENTGERTPAKQFLDRRRVVVGHPVGGRRLDAVMVAGCGTGASARSEAVGFTCRVSPLPGTWSGMYIGSDIRWASI